MEHQREVHNDSWESLKPDRGTVKKKQESEKLFRF